MEREDLKNKKLMELFGKTEFKTAETDPEFSEITNLFLFGDVCHFGNLDSKTREMITLVVLITSQLPVELKVHIQVALNLKITPIEIKELVYACVPYIGLPKTLNSLRVVNEIFKENNIQMPLESQKTTNEENRYEKGIELRNRIFGGDAKQTEENAIKGQSHIQKYLSEYCFGDWYTRNGLDIRTRELLTMTILVTLGGCENQLKAHIKANLNVGNTEEIIVNAITQAMPYIGFPRTLNALNCVNQIVKEKNANETK